MNETIKEESTHEPKTLSKVIKIDEAKIHSHLDRMVRSSVDQALNELPDAAPRRISSVTPKCTNVAAGSTLSLPELNRYLISLGKRFRKY
ncbi:MAG: hypothetical protein ACYTEQ_16180 [Planctomycetota bacterium]|jgi:hypothetical protein